MPIRQILFLLVVMLTVLSACAQETLTLEAALAYARVHHPALEVAQEDVAGALAGLRGAKALSNPEIVITPGVLGPAGSDEFISISQPLELNGARKARANAAAGALDAAQAKRRIAERAVLLAVRTAYWDLAQAQAIAAADAENMQHAEALLVAAKKQVELGNEPTAHVMKMEVELTRTRQQWARSQAAVAQATIALNTALGRDPSTPTILEDTLTQPSTTLDEVALYRLAETHRPELPLAQAGITIVQAEVAVARAARRPDVTIQVRQEEWAGDGGVGLGISLPLVDWGSTKADRQRAEAAVRAQGKRGEETRLAIRQEVATALVAVHSAESQLNTLRAQVLPPAERLAAMASLGFTEGAMTYLEVLDARRTVRAVKTEYLATLGEYHKALAQLTWAVGVETLPIPEKEVPR
ncbi:MAG: Cobalt-zinc-cadmium resistance protein CzcC precursor [bacterium ADurb.Bin429]|nr:MAG: Cobalt-zinc-cadmium resistance protein CzcC precursor [bacterium ADurb.Bin429]